MSVANGREIVFLFLVAAEGCLKILRVLRGKIHNVAAGRTKENSYCTNNYIQIKVAALRMLFYFFYHEGTKDHEVPPLAVAIARS